MKMRQNIHNNSEKYKNRGGKMDYNKLKTIKTLLTTMIFLTVITAACAQRGNQSQQQTRSLQTTPAHRNPIRQLADPVENRIDIAQQAANNIARIPGVQSANVLVTRRNAYVAAVLTRNNPLSGTMENTIAQRVRTTDPNINNVYVSTNPDFVNRINTYVGDVQQGRPVTGFFEEFNRMIQRVFPQPR
jgi:YhcN/YlaJ family sporulation lipoprotein